MKQTAFQYFHIECAIYKFLIYKRKESDACFYIKQ